MLAALQLGAALTRVVVGRISDRRGERVALLRGIALALTATFTVVAALVHAPNALLIPAILLGGSLAMSWQALPGTIASELTRPEHRGAALGLQTTVLVFAAALTPPAFGALVAASSWTVGFAVLAAAALVSSLILRPLAAHEDARGLAPAAFGNR